MYNVLFVDDDISLRYIVSKMKVWNNSEFRITKQAKNGQEALEFLENYDFDVVITDIRMPIIDGLELLELIRERNIDVFVVLVSTYSEFEYAKRGLQLGAVDYVIKPLKEDELRKVLDKLEKMLIEKYDNKSSKDKMYVISKENIKLWTDSIIRDKFYPEIMLQSFYEYVDTMGIENKQIYPSIIKEILERIWEEMLSSFSWLNYVSNLDNIFSEKNSEFEAVDALKIMKYISEKYMLYKYDNVINRICTIIAENIESNNIIEVVSDKLELSKDYIGKQFKAVMDMTLIEYCTFMKMEYAKKMLHDTSKKIYEISDAMGYSTVDYFTKLFKKYIGQTPSQYRKKIEK